MSRDEDLADGTSIDTIYVKERHEYDGNGYDESAVDQHYSSHSPVLLSDILLPQ